jgi:ribosomal protein S6--L-glutamate ligase
MDKEGEVSRDADASRSDLRLAILSRGPRLYSTRRLVEKREKRGLDPYVADPMKFSLFVADGPD